MSRLFSALLVLCAGAFSVPLAAAQSGASESAQLLELNKKLDTQNAKIDALSQQILKLEQMVEKEKAPASTTVGVPEESAAPVAAVASGSTHIVTRGETLTSIAKQYKVGIDELQRFNHIEDARKLQPGQKLAIPGASPAATAVASPAPSRP